MINVNNLCMQCMKEHSGAESCPHCGYREDGLQTAPYLPIKTWLMDRYLVGKMMTCDGEGVTYIGWDNVLQSAVLIREFLPGGLCQRVVESGNVRALPETGADYTRCLASFLELCRTLARMRDLSALFPVYDIFELNGTAYAISEYTESITLREFLHRNGDALTFEQARTLLMPPLSTLSSLHAAELIHGGISPETLYVGRDGKVRFGGFAGRELRTARGSLRSGLYSGYAAIEQYGFDGKIGPHTDVYALAGVFYRVVSGKAPADAKARMNQDTLPHDITTNQKLPSHAAGALVGALQLMPDSRTATVERFRAELSAAPTVTKEKMAVASPSTAPAITEPAPIASEIHSEEPHEKTKKKSKTWLYVVIAMLVTLLIAVGVLFVLESQVGLFGIFSGNESKDKSIPLTYPSSDPSVPSTVTSNAGATKTVPDLVGRKLDAVKNADSLFVVEEKYQVYDDAFAKGTIVSQTPEADAEIPIGEEPTVITVIVSKGSSKLTPPAVDGLTCGEALIALLDAGYPWDSINYGTIQPDEFDLIVSGSEFKGNDVNNAEVTLKLKEPVEATDPVEGEASDLTSVESAPAQ